jgi:ABC-type multidrug transport system fused ATPase/permease subunit
MKKLHIISIVESLTFCIDYIKKVKKYVPQLAILSIVSLFPLVITLLLPMLARRGIDTGLLARDVKRFLIIAGISGLLGIFMLLTQQWREFYQTLVRNMMTLSLKRAVISRMLKRDMRYFIQHESSHGINRILFDTERITETIVALPGEFIELIPRMLLAFACILYLDRCIGFIFLLISPVLMLPVFFTRLKIQHLYGSLWGLYEQIIQDINELFSHSLLIKAFHKERFIERKATLSTITHVRKAVEIARFEFALRVIQHLLTKGMVGLLLLYACLRVMHNEISLGTLTAVLAYAGQIVMLQGTLAYMLRRLIMTSVSCRRVDEILSCDTKEMQGGSLVPDLCDNNINVKKVGFSYDGDKSVFDAMSFSVNAGEILSIVGPSGCGKTTLAYLMMGLIRPLHGEITVAGKNIIDLDVSSYLGKIGIVLQEAFLINASLKENILFGMKSIADVEIIGLCRMCALNDLIGGLRNSFDTLLGERGVRLSAGQKQRVALARAIVRKPQLLIIDEGLSAVDGATERSILKGIRQYLPKSTIIIISHRLATILAADRIMMLDPPSGVVYIEPAALHNAPAKFMALFESQLIK